MCCLLSGQKGCLISPNQAKPTLQSLHRKFIPAVLHLPPLSTMPALVLSLLPYRSYSTNTCLQYCIYMHAAAAAAAAYSYVHVPCQTNRQIQHPTKLFQLGLRKGLRIKERIFWHCSFESFLPYCVNVSYCHAQLCFCPPSFFVAFSVSHYSVN